MLTACIDNVSDAYTFVLVARTENKLNYVSQMDSDTLILCHEIKSAEWFKTCVDAQNARDALSKYWNIDMSFRVAKYYMLNEVLCLL